MPTDRVIKIDAMSDIKVYKDIVQYNKGYKLQLFMFLLVKQSFTMSNIFVFKAVIKDLILDDKGVNISAEHQELHSSVQKLFKDNPMSGC